MELEFESMAINPMEINGNWDKGFILDFHVLSSTPIGENIYGHMEFDTVRTELGELVYQLKYRGRYENVDKILDLIKPFLDECDELREVDIVMPVPASKKRDFQPVTEIARAIAEYLGISFTDEVLEKNTSSQSKDMDRVNKNLSGSIVASIKATRPHNILIIDDLYSTGKTISECVSVLKADPLLKKIYVLLMTKTR